MGKDHKFLEILKPDKRYSNAPSEDSIISLSFTKTIKEQKRVNEVGVVDLNRQYQEERDSTDIYRIYGTINFISILTNKTNNIQSISDLFELVEDGRQFNLNCYLCKHQDFLEINDSTLRKRYKILTNTNEFDISKCGYARNIYSEPIYNFVFRNEIETTEDEIYLFFTENQYLADDLINGEIVDLDFNVIDYSNRYSNSILTVDNNDIYLQFDSLYKIPLKTEVNNTIQRRDFPYLNNIHYVYENVVLTQKQLINSGDTASVFSDFILGDIILDQFTTEPINNNC